MSSARLRSPETAGRDRQPFPRRFHPRRDRMHSARQTRGQTAPFARRLPQQRLRASRVQAARSSHRHRARRRNRPSHVQVPHSAQQRSRRPRRNRTPRAKRASDLNRAIFAPVSRTTISSNTPRTDSRQCGKFSLLVSNDHRQADLRPFCARSAGGKFPTAGAEARAPRSIPGNIGRTGVWARGAGVSPRLPGLAHRPC